MPLFLYFASYKDKRTIYRPESEWLRFENTHETIIDQTTWELVCKVRSGKRRKTSMGDMNKYSGILCCADCGSKLYFVRGTTIKPETYGFICSCYRKHMGEDNAHLTVLEKRCWIKLSLKKSVRQPTMPVPKHKNSLIFISGISAT